MERKKSPLKTENSPTQWHRLLGRILRPMFERLGHRLHTEVDIPRKQQFIDIITVQKAQGKTSFENLPKHYWENCFEDLNQHNLISFKSYSESFNGDAWIELISYLRDYCAHEKVDKEKVNLYAITQHHPQKLFAPLKGTKLLQEVEKGKVYDQWVLFHEVKIRFIVTGTTDHPLLGLFSGKKKRVEHCYEELQEEGELFEDAHEYFEEIMEYYGKEVFKMYTVGDWYDDHPPGKLPKFVFPWEAEYHEKEIKKVSEKAAKEAKEAKAETEHQHQIDLIQVKIDSYEELYQQKSISEEVYQAKVLPLQEKLKNIGTFQK